LVVLRLTYTWPFSNESVPVLTVPLAALGLGTGPPVLTSAATNFSVWIGLTGGLVGVDIVSRLPSRRLPLTPGDALVGLQYDISGEERRTYGVLVNGRSGATSIVSFLDSGAGVPALAGIPTALPATPDFANRVAILNDKGALLVISRGNITTFSLQDGRVLASAPACAGVDLCTIACAYEPFVFKS